MRGEPGNVAERGLERGARTRRRKVVFESDLQGPGHRRAAPPIDFQALPAGEDVRDEYGVAFHRPHLDGSPGHLLDEADAVARADHVADLERSLQCQRNPREQVPECLLQGQTDDRGDDRGGRQERRQAGGEHDLEQGAEGEAEDEEADDLANERGRGRPSAELVGDVEEQEVDQSRDDQGAGDADCEGAVVVSPRVGEGHMERGQEEDDAADDGEDPDRRKHPARAGGGEVRESDGHRAAILAAVAAGSSDSWNRRIAAMPAIRPR